MKMTKKIKQILADFHTKLVNDNCDEFYGFAMPEELFKLDYKLLITPNKFLTDLKNWDDTFFVYPKNNITLHGVELKKGQKYECKFIDIVEARLYHIDEEYGRLSIRFNPKTIHTELEELFLAEKELRKPKLLRLNQICSENI